MLAAYAGVLVHGVLRGHAARIARREHRHRVDRLGGLAAELRAGAITPAPALSAGTDRIDQLVGAATRLAERTGAPLADLLERIEADTRAMDRGQAAAAAQAAGARATAWLLAGLPVGGIALGYAIGTDPLDVLLHTTIGAACAIGAVLLQVAGLAWADRLAGAGSRVS